MRRNFMVALWLAMAPGCRCQPGGGTPTEAPVPGAAPLFVGRFVPEAGGAMRFAWGSSSVSARFSGTQVALNLQDAGDPNAPLDAQGNYFGNYFDVIVDERPPLVLPMRPHDTHYAVAQDLPAGEHQITVIKRTEALVGESLFTSLDLGPNGRLLPPPAPHRRRLEIIGDSISAGYGNEGTSEKCKFTPQTENVDLAYGPMTARALDADVTVVAWSGKGVLRNGDGKTTETLPQLYGRSLPARPDSSWDFTRWTPDAVVINLGTNDFTPGVPDSVAFSQAYTTLLHTVRQHYPKAYILCAVGPMLTDDFPKGGNHLSIARSYVTQAVNSMQDKRVAVLEFPMQTGHRGYGCDWHPSLATHAAMAAQLTAALKVALGW